MPGQGPSTPRHVPKPWGSEEIWAETDAYIGKILTIRQGHRLSLQHHAIKDETIRVVRGALDLTLEDACGVLRTQRLGPGDVVRIHPLRRHRMHAVTDVEIYEVSTSHVDDVVRHEDDYGRV